MTPFQRDVDRERRISTQIVAGCYDAVEEAAGWWCYLDTHLHVPFPARCIAERAISPLQPGDEIEVTGIATEDECEREMFVTVEWDGRPLAVPLAQLEALPAADPTTQQAIADWHYWLAETDDL